MHTFLYVIRALILFFERCLVIWIFFFKVNGSGAGRTHGIKDVLNLRSAVALRNPKPEPHLMDQVGKAQGRQGQSFVIVGITATHICQKTHVGENKQKKTKLLSFICSLSQYCPQLDLILFSKAFYCDITFPEEKLICMIGKTQNWGGDESSCSPQNKNTLIT